VVTVDSGYRTANIPGSNIHSLESRQWMKTQWSPISDQGGIQSNYAMNLHQSSFRIQGANRVMWFICKVSIISVCTFMGVCNEDIYKWQKSCKMRSWQRLRSLKLLAYGRIEMCTYIINVIITIIIFTVLTQNTNAPHTLHIFDTSNSIWLEITMKMYTCTQTRCKQGI